MGKGIRVNVSSMLVMELLLFAIKMATLPFWAEIKKLRTRRREAYRFVSSGRIGTVLSDS